MDQNRGRALPRARLPPLPTELETVYEEKNRSLDNKSRVIRKAVQEQVYKVHPYRVTHARHGRAPENPSLERMYEFYHTYYVPNNMAIFIRATSTSTRPSSSSTANSRSGNAGNCLNSPSTKSLQSTKWNESRSIIPARNTYFWPFARRSAHTETPRPCRSSDMILDNATAGLINLNLNQQQKVRKSGSYPYLLNDYGAQYLWGIPKQDQTLAEVEGSAFGAD